MDLRTPYAPPQAPHDPAPVAEVQTDAEPGGFGIRVAARAIDVVVSWLVGVAGRAIVGIGLAVAKATGTELGSGRPRSLEALALGLLVTAAGNIGYHVLAEGIGGASVGKALLGLQVRNVDLSPCRIRGALIRSLAYYVDALFFGVVAYNAMSKSEMMQRYGDQWGGTVVVRASSLRRDADGRLRMALGLTCGLAVALLAAIASGLAGAWM